MKTNIITKYNKVRKLDEMQDILQELNKLYLSLENALHAWETPLHDATYKAVDMLIQEVAEKFGYDVDTMFDWVYHHNFGETAMTIHLESGEIKEICDNEQFVEVMDSVFSE